jgi:hypothetical protein
VGVDVKLPEFISAEWAAAVFLSGPCGHLWQGAVEAACPTVGDFTWSQILRQARWDWCADGAVEVAIGRVISSVSHARVAWCCDDVDVVAYHLQLSALVMRSEYAYAAVGPAQRVAVTAVLDEGVLRLGRLAGVADALHAALDKGIGDQCRTAPADYPSRVADVVAAAAHISGLEGDAPLLPSGALLDRGLSAVTAALAHYPDGASAAHVAHGGHHTLHTCPVCRLAVACCTRNVVVPASAFRAFLAFLCSQALRSGPDVGNVVTRSVVWALQVSVGHPPTLRLHLVQVAVRLDCLATSCGTKGVPGCLSKIQAMFWSAAQSALAFSSRGQK